MVALRIVGVAQLANPLAPSRDRLCQSLRRRAETRRVPPLLVCASVLFSTTSLHGAQQAAGWASRTDYVAVGRDGMVVYTFASQAIADTTAAQVFIDPNRAVAEDRESNNAQTSELVCERQ